MTTPSQATDAALLKANTAMMESEAANDRAISALIDVQNCVAAERLAAVPPVVVPVPPVVPPVVPPPVVQPPPVVTPPVVVPPSIPAMPNLPAGLSIILNDGFETLDPANALGSIKKSYAASEDYAGGLAVVVSDGPRSAGQAIRQVFQPGKLPGGSSPGIVERTFPKGVSLLYAACWYRRNPETVRHPSNINKLLYVGGMNGLPVYVMEYGTTASAVPAVCLQGIAQNYTAGGITGKTVILGPNLGKSAPPTLGQWHLFELVLQGNRAGKADGTADLFFDGVHVVGYGGIGYSSGDMLFTSVQFSPQWGGAGSFYPAGVPGTMDLDHWTVAGK